MAFAVAIIRDIREPFQGSVVIVDVVTQGVGCNWRALSALNPYTSFGPTPFTQTLARGEPALLYSHRFRKVRERILWIVGERIMICASHFSSSASSLLIHSLK